MSETDEPVALIVREATKVHAEICKGTPIFYTPDMIELAIAHGWIPAEWGADGQNVAFMKNKAERTLYRNDITQMMDVVIRKGLLAVDARAEIKVYDLRMYPDGDGKGYGCIRAANTLFWRGCRRGAPLNVQQVIVGPIDVMTWEDITHMGC